MERSDTIKPVRPRAATMYEKKMTAPTTFSGLCGVEVDILIGKLLCVAESMNCGRVVISQTTGGFLLNTVNGIAVLSWQFAGTFRDALGVKPPNSAPPTSTCFGLAAKSGAGRGANHQHATGKLHCENGCCGGSVVVG